MASFGSYVSGQILTAAELNAEGAWTSYTPTLTNIAKGNATTWDSLYYKFNQIGFLSINFVLGSTSTVTGDITITLPTGWTAKQNVGLALTVVAGTSYISHWRISAAGTNILIRANNASGTYLTSTNASATVPATWTTGDSIRCVATLDLS